VLVRVHEVKVFERVASVEWRVGRKKVLLWKRCDPAGEIGQSRELVGQRKEKLRLIRAKGNRYKMRTKGGLFLDQKRVQLHAALTGERYYTQREGDLWSATIPSHMVSAGEVSELSD